MYKQLSRNFSWMASHRQRCIVEYLSVAYHIREISHRGNNITARNISPVASNKVEERNISSRLCTLKHSDFFIPHFRYILKLSRHASFRFERVSKLKYTRYIFFIEQPQFRFVRARALTHDSHTHRSMDIFSKGNYFLALAVFSPWNDFLSNRRKNCSRVPVLITKPPEWFLCLLPTPPPPPQYLTENTTTYYDS